MNITIIENEVNNFCADYFREAALGSKACLDFIEKNELYTPKENYTILIEFLDTTRKRFKVLDSNFESITLEKISKDVRALEGILTPLKKDSENINELFITNFIKSSEVLSTLQKEIVAHKLLIKNDISEKSYLVYIESNFKELKRIYYEVFEEMFYADREYYIDLLLESLNFMTYYYDKLLWEEAANSNFIIKHFQVKQIAEKINSKYYLKHILSLMRPYTEKYEYYQSCIRIYK